MCINAFHGSVRVKDTVGVRNAKQNLQRGNPRQKQPPHGTAGTTAEQNESTASPPWTSVSQSSRLATRRNSFCWQQNASPLNNEHARRVERVVCGVSTQRDTWSDGPSFHVSLVREGKGGRAAFRRCTPSHANWASDWESWSKPPKRHSRVRVNAPPDDAHTSSATMTHTSPRAGDHRHAHDTIMGCVRGECNECRWGGLNPRLVHRTTKSQNTREGMTLREARFKPAPDNNAEGPVHPPGRLTCRCVLGEPLADRPTLHDTPCTRAIDTRTTRRPPHPVVVPPERQRGQKEPRPTARRAGTTDDASAPPVLCDKQASVSASACSLPRSCGVTTLPAPTHQRPPPMQVHAQPNGLCKVPGGMHPSKQTQTVTAHTSTRRTLSSHCGAGRLSRHAERPFHDNQTRPALKTAAEGR